MPDDSGPDDLGREIERSWLYRDEYDKVFEARGLASLLLVESY